MAWRRQAVAWTYLGAKGDVKALKAVKRRVKEVLSRNTRTHSTTLTVSDAGRAHSDVNGAKILQRFVDLPEASGLASNLDL